MDIHGLVPLDIHGHPCKSMVKIKFFRLGGCITNYSKTINVPDRYVSISRKDNTNGQAPHVSFSVVPEDTLAISPVSRPEDSSFKSSEKLSSVVERSKKNLRKGCPLHPQEHNTLIFTDASNQGSGAHLENLTVSGNWTDQEKLLHINVLELKAVFLALKSFQNRILDKRVLSNRQRHCSQLSEQTRGNTLMGHVSPGLAHLGLLQSSKHTHQSQTHSGLPQCHSRQSLQERQNNSDRMVSSSSNIQSNLQSLAHTNGGQVCHQIESQATNLCLTSPRCKCYEHRCIEHLLGGSGRLCLLSCSSHTKGHTENEHLQVQNDSSSTRVAQNALVLGSSQSVNQAPLQLPHWPHLLKQPFSQKFHHNLM